MSSLIEHAKKEMELAWPKQNEMQDMVKYNVLELMQVFADQGHSGFSAPYVLDVFNKLAMYKTIAPLTGEDDEWGDPNPYDGTQQNKRCGTVFRKNGVAYNMHGYVFWHWSERELEEDEEGYPNTEKFRSSFTSKLSRKPITFPYTLEDPEHIEVESYEVDKDTGVKKEGTGWWETVYPDAIKETGKALDIALGKTK